MGKEYPRMVAFGPGRTDDVAAEEYGNKASNLARMSALGICVPPGFSLGVSICEEFHRNSAKLPHDVPELLRNGIAYLESATGFKFGGSRKPLLVSVRSGAAVSMPGIMETLLNVGLNHQTLQGMILSTGNPRSAYDSYRRIIESFGCTVFSHDPQPYNSVLSDALDHEEVPDETELDYLTLKAITEEYEMLFQVAEGRPFPQVANEQLELAVTAVLRSWRSPRAEVFRRMNLVRNVRGTAVTVQAMVFGNTGPNSGAGVVFTRNPSSGENAPWVDFRFGAQGEDVVSGERSASAGVSLDVAMPELHAELIKICRKLEQHFSDMQDLEITVQDGKLFVLQCRSGKRAPLAALRIAVELCREGVISPEEAIARLKDTDLDAILFQHVVSSQSSLAGGLSASAGVAFGRIALTSERAAVYASSGPVILVRETASPDDISGISASSGLLTVRGARTSHAAVVARQLGKVCIVDCIGLSIDLQAKKIILGTKEISEGEIITLDGNTGAVYEGKATVSYEKPFELLSAVKDWKTAYDTKK